MSTLLSWLASWLWPFSSKRYVAFSVPLLDKALFADLDTQLVSWQRFRFHSSCVAQEQS
jgi:hypothetical protein